MTVMTVFALARDFAGIALALAVALMAIVFWSGAAGLSGGLAASMAVVAMAGLASFAFYGLSMALIDPPLSVVALATAVVLLTGAFFGAQYFGVRGLWLAFLSTVGAGVAWLLIAAVAIRLGRGAESAFGVAAPLLVFVLLALLNFGALSAAARAAAERMTARDQGGSAQAEVAVQAEVQARARAFAMARAMFAAPPDWFDCAYATLGGQAARPAFCPFNPPRVATAPDWSRAPALAPSRDAPLDVAARAGDAPVEPGGPAPAPAMAEAPAAPSISTPNFDDLRSGEGAAPPSPDRLASVGDGLDRVAGIDDRAGAADDGPDAPMPGAAPEPLAAALEADLGPPPASVPEAPAVAGLADAPPRPAEPGAATPMPGESERRRSVFVCFPMLGALAEKLCPDHRLTEADFDLRWREPGGEAKARPEQVECFFDPDLALHVTLLVNLSGDLVGPMARTAQPGANRMRKADAIYEMVTRLLGAARVGGGDMSRERLYLSMYVANGSRLLSPWAAQDFGPERSDRLFDVRSSGQTLALLRRLKSETQTLRRGALGGDLAAALTKAMDERPDPPFEAGQELILLITDVAASSMITEQEARTLAARLTEQDTPLFAVALDAAAPPPALKHMADLTGGAAYGVSDAGFFAEVIEKAVLRARSFCALQIRAPESFFERAELEVRLRRRLDDGCVLERVATVSCEGLSMNQRIEPGER